MMFLRLWLIGVYFCSVNQAELMCGFIEFCVELKSVSEGGAAAEMDGEGGRSPQPAEQDGSNKNAREGRRGMLRRQSSVVCSRVHSLNTISYVDNGEPRVHLFSPSIITV